MIRSILWLAILGLPPSASVFAEDLQDCSSAAPNATAIQGAVKTYVAANNAVTLVAQNTAFINTNCLNNSACKKTNCVEMWNSKVADLRAAETAVRQAATTAGNLTPGLVKVKFDTCIQSIRSANTKYQDLFNKAQGEFNGLQAKCNALPDGG